MFLLNYRFGVWLFAAVLKGMMVKFLLFWKVRAFFQLVSGSIKSIFRMGKGEELTPV